MIDAPLLGEDGDSNRGTHIADGGFAELVVRYPDPARIAEIHQEWADQGEGQT